MQPKSFNLLRMIMLAMAFTFISCSEEQEMPPLVEQDITLTTPVIKLDGVHVTNRVAQSLKDVASSAHIHLFLHDSEERKQNGDRTGSYYDIDFSDGISWTAEPSVTVTITGDEGHYHAGTQGIINLKTTTDMPAIIGAIYAYRGGVNVEANGTFTPDGTLQPYTSAVLLNLKDADGNTIDPEKFDTPDGNDAEGAKQNSKVYLIKPKGLAKMNGFAPTDAAGNVDWVLGDNFPNGTGPADYAAILSPSYLLSAEAQGLYVPGTYPATWLQGVLNSSASVPSEAWPLFEVTYCKDGFSGKTPNGPATTWTVNYPAEHFTLERGKLYTFTATLGADDNITIAPSSVTITDWLEGR